MMDVKAGDVVWYAPSGQHRGHGEPHYVTVESVGRKWVRMKFNRLRFDRNTGEVDGGAYSSPGTVYRTREEWQAAVDLDRAWQIFRIATQRCYRPPSGVTAEHVREAMRLLRVDDGRESGGEDA